MKAKEHLRQVRRIKVAINGKIERMTQLRAIAESTTSPISDMPMGGGAKDKVGAMVASIVDFSNEIATDAAVLVEMQRRVQLTINKIPNQNYRTVLELYYLNGDTWNDVAEKMGYSIQHIHRLHGEALSEYER